MKGKAILFNLFMLLLILAGAEIMLRISGFTPYVYTPTNIHAEPSRAVLPHPEYGISLNPGTFQVTINEGLHYQATHLADSSRLSLPPSDTLPKKGLYFYGCSFTYGMGVSDEEAFPALLQQAFAEYRVKNYACPGWSSLHALLVMKKQLERGKCPEMAILGYTSLQDARNQLTGIQQKYWREAMFPDLPEAATRKVQFPYACLEENTLKIHYKPLAEFSQRWALSKYSATAYRLENAISNIRYGFADKYELTERIIQEMADRCREKGVRFIVVALDKSESADKLAGFCREEEIEFVDATLDISNSRYNLSPYDSHPNKEAHRFYAKRIVSYLNP